METPQENQHYKGITHLLQVLHLGFGTMHLLTQPTIQGMLAVILFHSLLPLQGDYGRI